MQWDPKEKERIDRLRAESRWWWHADTWPDEQVCELCWFLAQTMLALQEACLVGNPAPVVEEMWQRMKEPQVGDVVLETTTVASPDWPERALGILRKRPYQHTSFDDEWVVDSLYFPDQAQTTWHNASFIALPVNYDRYLHPPGRVTFTRESLVGALTEKGFQLQ